MKRIIFLLLFCSRAYSLDIIAHRGASGYMPEHTLEAYSLAAQMNSDYLEPDVVLSKDNIPVVLHDIHLETTTDVQQKFPKRMKNGHYYAIDFTLSELKTLKVHERTTQDGKQVYPKRFPSDIHIFQIPTLHEVLELTRGLTHSLNRPIGICIELKNALFHEKHKKDIVQITYKALLSFSSAMPQIPIIIQSFEPTTLKRLRTEFNSRYPLLQLVGDEKWPETPVTLTMLKDRNSLRRLHKYADHVGLWVNHLMKKNPKGEWIQSPLLSALKEEKIGIYAYTYRKDALPTWAINESNALKILQSLELDGIFTDFPDAKIRPTANLSKGEKVKAFTVF